MFDAKIAGINADTADTADDITIHRNNVSVPLSAMVIELSEGKQFKISQVAGIIARRIVCNLCEGDRVQQGDELGFIFFGSRVDVYLPLWAKIKIKSGDTVIRMIKKAYMRPGEMERINITAESLKTADNLLLTVDVE